MLVDCLLPVSEFVFRFLIAVGQSVLIYNIYITIGTRQIVIAAPVNTIKRHSKFCGRYNQSPIPPVFVCQHHVADFETRPQRSFFLFAHGQNAPDGGRAAIQSVEP